MATDDAGQQALKDAIWKYTGQGALFLTVLLCGFLGGWLVWGDAPKVRADLEDCKANREAIRAERENANYEISRLKRENERLGKEAAAAKASAAPPPAAAAATP